jgi:hypothetical protein
MILINGGGRNRRKMRKWREWRKELGVIGSYRNSAEFSGVIRTWEITSNL